MKTITYSPETHVLVPIEPEWFVQYTSSWDHFKHMGKAWIGRFYRSAIAAAPQPEPVESEPVAFTNKAQLGYVTDGMHPDIPLAMWSKNTPYADANIPLYTQPPADASRVAELEKVLKVARDALNRAADKFHDYAEIHAAKEASPENDVKVERNLALAADMDKALAKINEVLK